VTGCCDYSSGCSVCLKDWKIEQVSKRQLVKKAMVLQIFTVIWYGGGGTYCNADIP
jgi:hypothetical protein